MYAVVFTIQQWGMFLLNIKIELAKLPVVLAFFIQPSVA